MSAVHDTAIISDGACIDPSAEIGPYAVIGPHVKLGPRTKVGAHSVIDGHTTIGADCHIYSTVSIGLEPQDLGYKGEPTGVIIGDRVTIREFVTVHRATGEGFTTIGDECFLMNYVHIAHNCKLGKGVVLANATMMAGHVTIDDYTVMSGHCIFHQFVRVGRLCMVSGLTGTRQDLPPFTILDGRPAKVRGINRIGLRRRGVGQAVRSAIKETYRLLYRSGLTRQEAIGRIVQEVEQFPEIVEIIDFFQTTKRGVTGALDETYESLDEEAMVEAL